MHVAGDETLTGSKYLWLYAGENVPEVHQDRFLALQQQNPEDGPRVSAQGDVAGLVELHAHGLGAAFPATLVPLGHAFAAPAGVVQGSTPDQAPSTNVLTYCTHPITNAVCEGLNSKIQPLKKRAYGFRNKEHFKTAIYFHCGGLQLYPATHGIPG